MALSYEQVKAIAERDLAIVISCEDPMTHTFVIAEAACTWEGSLEEAGKSIKAAKACGADAWKTQWTSDHAAIARRRCEEMEEELEVYSLLAWPKEYHAQLKALCDLEGIEYMCTVFLPDDVEVIAPYVKRFKIAARESQDIGFIESHWTEPYDKKIIVSFNPGKWWPNLYGEHPVAQTLHCVSRYPTELCDLKLRHGMHQHNGLSDHTTSLLTGALAVACGASIIEHHVRNWETPKDNPDYPHSHAMDARGIPPEGSMIEASPFAIYVQNIREAEQAMG